MGYGPKYGLILKWSGYRYSVLTYIYFLKAVDIIKKNKQEKIGMRNKIMVNTIKMVREKMGMGRKMFQRTTLQRLSLKTELTPEKAAETILGRKTVFGSHLKTF